ncbi:MAG: hypothetical protein ACP5P9_10060 [Acidimicrobiales bacterium]
MARRLKPAPTVELGRPGEAAGMAAMVAELVRANLADSPSRARVARRVRGSIVLLADDRSLGVTLSFGEDGVVIDASPAPGLPVLAGPWLTMATVCAGARSPLSAVARRELHVEARRPLRALLAAAYVLKVPRSAGRT